MSTDQIVPTTYGKLSSEAESSAALQSLGWSVPKWRTRIEYDGLEVLLRKQITSKSPIQVPSDNNGNYLFRRRAIDNYALMGEQARDFERKNESDVPNRYDYRGCLDQDPDTSLQDVLNVAIGEFCTLSYLFPLAAVAQAARVDALSPMLMRVWQFSGEKQALFKSLPLRLDGECNRELIAGCVVSEPPPPKRLSADRSVYTLFRSSIGHELAHYCLDHMTDKYEGLADFKDPQDPRTETAASLLGILLVLYRGGLQWTERSPDELHQELECLELETKWARHNKNKIVDQVYSRITALACDQSFVGALPEVNPEHLPLGSGIGCGLTDSQIRLLCTVANDLTQASRPYALSSMAYTSMLRKVDTTISYGRVDPEQWHSIQWEAHDLTATHQESKHGTKFSWRNYQIRVPQNIDGHLSRGQMRQMAFHIASIRLFGGGYGQDKSPQSSGEVQRLCTDYERDFARIAALCIYAFRGCRTRAQYSRDTARALLAVDTEGLRGLIPHADRYLYWCTRCDGSSNVRAKYRGELCDLSQNGENAYVSFWGQNGKRMRTVLPWSRFEAAGFSKEDIGASFGLQVESRDGRNVMRPINLAK